VDDPHSEREGVKTHDSAVGFCALTGESLVTFTEDENKERMCTVQARTSTWDRPDCHPLRLTTVASNRASLGLSLKWTMAPIVVEDEDEFKDLVQETFEKIPHRISFAKKWREKFLDFQKLS